MSEIRRSENNSNAGECAAKKRITPVIMLLTVLLAALFPFASAQGALQVYDVGAIPDQTVWHGAISNFLVNWDHTPSVSFSMEADPQPNGAISIEPFEDAYGLFTYVPDAGDKTPFTVTIVASLGVQTTSQSFVMTPQPNLMPEQTVFGTHDHVPPVVTTYEIKVFDREILDEEENFNYHLNTKTRSVQIVGENVEIEAGHDNGLYEAYFDGSQWDIKEMEIIGETVTFRSPARLKQTNVTIYARNLRFEGDGQLKTTPEEETTTPLPSIAGVTGLNAGTVTLYVSQVYYDTPGVKIDLTGGKGQKGGAGQDGADGVSVSSSYCVYYQDGRCGASCDMVLDTGYYLAPAGQTVTWIGCGDGWGDSTWPTSGTNAEASGKPGVGGDGGDLTSNQDLIVGFSNYGGASGAPNSPSSGWSYYRGGNAGWPAYALHVKFYWDTWSACVSVDYVHQNPTWPTQNGANAEVTPPDRPAGYNGSYDVSGSPYAWLHPLMLRKILNHAREDYIGEHIAEAEARFSGYVAILDEYKADASWDALDGMPKFELEQMYDEMQILLQQIENNLDYFGNPAGWVPMLSFEVNYAMFSQEIDRAIRMLYLAYWIRTTEKGEAHKADALVAAREQLRLEIEQAKADYDDAVNRIPLLKSKAENLKVEIVETQGQLEARENELIHQTHDPAWLACLKGALKGAAWACKIVPVYQPGIGAMGRGLEQISDIDPDMPWASILGTDDDVASTFLNSGFDIAALNQQTAKNGIDPYAVESNASSYLDDMREASAGLSAGLADVKGFMAENKAPEPGMLSELERLKSMDPEYQELVKKIEALMLKNREFTDELISTMQKVAALSNLITRNMLAIDAMNHDAAPGLLVCDGRATAYLDDMEQRTYNRLLKYHYYLAKAYEYRLLKPYTETLNLQGLLQKFEDIASLPENVDHTISPDQFDQFRALYEAKLSLVAEDIYGDYNANTPELSTGLPFALTSDEIARLNQGETVPLNLMGAGFFFPDEENVRIVDLNVYSIVTEPVGGSYGINPMLRIRMEHSGISNFKTDGSIYQFRHYNSETENPIIWEARWYPDLQILNQTKPSAASQSLLCTLLGSFDCQSLMFFSRPSAWADLRISRSCRDGECARIKIVSVILELDFDFMPRNESLARKDLEILVSQASADGGDSVESSFMPYFVLNRPDFNGRQDARGRALRIYEYSSAAVEVTAQSSYGAWGFDKWTDRFGFDLLGEVNPTISVMPYDDLVICAQYVSVGLCDADFDGDGDVDGYDLAVFDQNSVGLSALASEFGRVDCNP
jgi:hypothetical protein